MLIALLILTVLLSAQTVRVWVYRRRLKRSMDLTRKALAIVADKDKALAGAKTVNKILIRGMNGKLDEEKEWPELIG